MQMLVMLAVVLFFDWEGLSEAAVTVLAAPTPRPTSLNPAPRPSFSAPFNPFSQTIEERTAALLDQDRRDSSMEQAKRAAAVR